MTAQADFPVWRSMLYVPVNVDKFVDKAHTRGADAIQLDLEDAVPAGEKDHARTLVRAAAAKVSRGGADVVVRINQPLRMAIRDLEATVCPDVQAIALTKTEGASHVRLISQVLGELEIEQSMTLGATRIVAMIETAPAYARMEEIGRADPRVVGMILAGEDFAWSCGMQPEPDGLYVPKVQSLIAARAVGVMPLGFVGSIADFSDLDAFREMVRRSRRLGFEGAGCIHPAQAKILNEEFRPTDDEVDKARRIVAAYAEAAAAGRGSFQMDGRMIDVPIVVRAERLIKRHQAILEREHRLAEAIGE